MKLFLRYLLTLSLLSSVFSNRLQKDSPKFSRRYIEEEQHSINSRATLTRYVFAHFIVGIVSTRTSAADWDEDMQRAKASGIDAFALNIGTDYFTDTQLGYAYTSAANNGLKVFLSFDFAYWAGSSPSAIGQKIAQYANMPAQLQVDNKIFVSSFYGDGVDVGALRSAAGTPLFFAPNFHPSSGTDMSGVDGALNWLGWPNNGNNRAPAAGQTGTVEAGDTQYINAVGLNGYIAPVSPWFFTHYGTEVAYSKNWLFPGDALWYTRWNELLSLGSRFIEIVSWNDFGESHYVGPLSAIHKDDGASKWVNDMPHNGWLDLAVPYIAAFKAGATSVSNYINSDQIIYWYRPQPMNTNCDSTDTCMGPCSNPDYYVGPPNGWQTVSDSVFVVTLLQSAGTLTVSSGGNVTTFNAPAGANLVSVPMNVGQQTFTLTRNGATVLTGKSLKDIINGCVCGLYNFNAYVGALPPSFNDPLGSDGLLAFTNGLRVTTCSATASLGSNTASTTTSSSTTTTTVMTTTTSSSSTTSSTTATSTTTTSSSITSSTTSTSTITSSSTSTSSVSTTTSSKTSSSTSSLGTTSSTTGTSTTSSTTTSPTTTSSTISTTTASTTTTPTTTASTTSSSAIISSTTSTSASTSSTSKSSTTTSTISTTTTSSVSTSTSSSVSSATTSSSTTSTSSTTGNPLRATLSKASSSSASSTTTGTSTSSSSATTTSSSSTQTSSTATSSTSTSSSTTSTTFSSSTTSKTSSATISSSTSAITSSSSTTTSSSSTTKTSTSTTTTSSPTTTSSTPTTSSSSSITKSSTSTTTTSSSSIASTTTSKSSTATTTSTSTSTASTSSSSTSSAPASTSTVCTSGSGNGNYGGLCSFCCQYGYCPSGPCTCTAYGLQKTPPPTTGVNGVPADGLDSSYSGLCSYACNHGYCPSSACKAAS